MMPEAPPEIWTKEMVRLERRINQMNHQKDLVVFYGSSSIRLWVNMQHDLAPLNLLNLGFGGSSYAWCIHYFSRLFGQLTPSRVILYAGENDLSHGASVHTILADFTRLTDLISETFPGTKMAVISLKPSPHRLDLLENIQRINSGLKEIMQNGRGDYIEIFTPMLDEQNRTRPELYLSDGLHMNREGYRIWTRVIREYFKLD